MKKIFLSLFLLFSSVFGATPFTVENVDNLRIIIKNNSNYVSKKQIQNIKADVKKNLRLSGISFMGSDPNLLIITIDTTEVNKTHIANIQFVVAEEIITRRKNSIESFAFTYHSNDFFTIEEKTDIKESIDMLTEQFLELYKEDME